MKPDVIIKCCSCKNELEIENHGFAGGRCSFSNVYYVMPCECNVNDKDKVYENRNKRDK